MMKNTPEVRQARPHYLNRMAVFQILYTAILAISISELLYCCQVFLFRLTQDDTPLGLANSP